MADFVFNIAKGKVKYYAELPAANDALRVVLLKNTGLETDSTLRDYDNLSALLAGSSDEADFTNYSRKTLAGIALTVDDTNDRLDVDADDITWTSAGGAANNTLGKLLICYDDDTTGGNDTNIIPLTAHDFVVTTDGSDLIGQVAVGGWFRAS